MARTEEVIASEQGLWRAKQVMHCDIDLHNALSAPDGAVLLDFDSAGAQAPWWEVACTAFEVAGARGRTVRDSVDAMVIMLDEFPIWSAWFRA